jgi:hypothetical protein
MTTYTIPRTPFSWSSNSLGYPLSEREEKVRYETNERKLIDSFRSYIHVSVKNYFGAILIPPSNRSLYLHG